jgi:hypothetical protein
MFRSLADYPVSDNPPIGVVKTLSSRDRADARR